MLVPVYKRANPSVRGLADPSTLDPDVWVVGVPAESPDAPSSPRRGTAHAGPDVSDSVQTPDASLGDAEPDNHIDAYVEPVGRGRGRKGR